MSASDVVGGVLCAGYGTRMRPLTESVPKPLLPFLNTPILTYALDHLATAGIERVGMNLHHLPDTIPPVADRLCRQFGLDPAYSREWEILGTAGGIRGIWHALGEPDAPLVVTNGDSVLNVDLAEHLDRHRETEAAVTLVVRPKADEQPGKIWLDDDGALEGMRDYRRGGADDSEFEEFDFTGIHILQPEVLADIPLEEGCIVDDIYGPMIEEGASIRASVQRDFWAALDNPGLLMETTRQVLAEPDRFEQAPLSETGGEGVFVAEPDRSFEGIEIEPPVFVGRDVEFGEGVRLGPNAVVDGVEFGDEVAVEDAILYGCGEVDQSRRNCVAVADRLVEL